MNKRPDKHEWVATIIFAISLAIFFWIAANSAGCGDSGIPLNDYCGGSPAVGVSGPVQPGIGSLESKIIDSTPSTDRRGTAKVWFSRGFCTATIIGPHTAVFAAHCDGEGHAIHVDEMRYPAVFFPHPDYKTYPYDDIALLFTAAELPGPYIALYDWERDTGDCSGFLAQGYGEGSNGLAEKPYMVRHVGQRLLLTSGEGGSTCYGDSGGPLYAIDEDGTPRLAGVSSTGFDLECLSGGHHVRVDYYTDWIQENLL